METQPLPTYVPPHIAAPSPNRRVAIICSKGGLDEAYPALILANSARASGIDAMIFFTFYGLDVIAEKKVDHLHVNMTGNPSSPMPTLLAGLPGMESLAAGMMRKRMAELDLPGAREMLVMLADAGCELYACELAMKMFKLAQSDLLPQVKAVISATDFFELTGGAQIIFT
jgi:peroxiredoxin family protein